MDNLPAHKVIPNPGIITTIRLEKVYFEKIMPKKVKLVNHLNSEELKEKYILSLDPIESRRWHLLWKISQSWSIKDSAIAVGISYEYAREIVRKYNLQGILAVINKKKTIKRKGRTGASQFCNKY
jgi:hypothetical protein